MNELKLGLCVDVGGDEDVDELSVTISSSTNTSFYLPACLLLFALFALFALFLSFFLIVCFTVSFSIPLFLHLLRVVYRIDQLSG